MENILPRFISRRGVFWRKSKTCKTYIDFHYFARYNASVVLQVKLVTQEKRRKPDDRRKEE